MPLGTEVGLGPGDIVLDGDPPSPERGTAAAHFLAYAYCGQMAGWIMMPLGTEVGLGLGDFELDGDPTPQTERGTTFPQFSARVYCG